jgi:hypothetical protein
VGIIHQTVQRIPPDAIPVEIVVRCPNGK